MIAKYRELYPTGAYLNHEIGFEKTIPDDATEEEMIAAIVKLKQVSDKCHAETAPKDLTPHDTEQPKLKEINLAADRLEVLIENAATGEELASYWLDAQKYGVVDQYTKRLKELQ